MRVQFSDCDEWLDELRFICSGDAESAPAFVRISIEKAEGKDGSGHDYNDLFVFGSFEYDFCLYELICECGQEYVHFKMGEGKATAEETLSRVKSGCGEIGVPVRGGRVLID